MLLPYKKLLDQKKIILGSGNKYLEMSIFICLLNI